jgi:large subunit ribosomal protein L25
MNRIPLTAEKRTLMGRKLGRLRLEGILPANIYGNNVDSLAVQVPLKVFMKVFEEAGETGLIDLNVAEGEKRPVLVHDVQMDPVSDIPLHVDFHQVNLKEEVDANVPVVVEGESPAEKQGIGTVVQVVNELPVRALPDQLPQEFIVDISNLTEVDQSISVADLNYDKEHVKIDVENPEDMVLVKVDALVDVEAELAAQAAEDTAETPAEGETPAPEGGETPTEVAAEEKASE